jgi:hypothetical protein
MFHPIEALRKKFDFWLTAPAAKSPDWPRQSAGTHHFISSMWGMLPKNQRAAVMQTRSRTFEIPSGLSLPLAFGMNTRLIGSGR